MTLQNLYITQASANAACLLTAPSTIARAAYFSTRALTTNTAWEELLDRQERNQKLAIVGAFNAYRIANGEPALPFEEALTELQRVENALHARRDPQRWAYIHAALPQAQYKTYSDGAVFAEIPGLDGVLACAATREAAEVELAAALDSWITARLHYHLAIPPVAGLDLNPSATV